MTCGRRGEITEFDRILSTPLCRHVTNVETKGTTLEIAPNLQVQKLLRNLTKNAIVVVKLATYLGIAQSLVQVVVVEILTLVHAITVGGVVIFHEIVLSEVVVKESSDAIDVVKMVILLVIVKVMRRCAIPVVKLDTSKKIALKVI